MDDKIKGLPISPPINNGRESKKPKAIWLLLLLIPAIAAISGTVWLAATLYDNGTLSNLKIDISDEEALSRINKTLHAISYSTAGEVTQEVANPASDAFGDSSFTSLIEGEDTFELLSSRIKEIQTSEGFSCAFKDNEVICNKKNLRIALTKVATNTTELRILDKYGNGE